ncbi:MAG TPA: hypothetical protein VFK54_01670 [Candidatus Limnocylindrales bacterium]|nr:hypothetical protein [Candidatus Limnocylindrales bacterium]
MDEVRHTAIKRLRRAGAQRRDLSASIGLVATGCVRRVLVVGLADPLGAIAHVRTAALRAGVVVEPLDGASPTTAVLVRPGPSVVG